MDMETINVAYLPIWKRYLELFEEAELTNKEIGQLVYGMMEYQFRGIEPEKLPARLKIIWTFLRTDLDNARAKYEVAVINGRKGGRKKKQKEPNQTTQNHEEGISITESISTTESMSTSESISESISETISISERETKTIQEQETFSADAGDLSLSEITFGEFGWVTLTLEQYQQLERLMGTYELSQCIKYIDESAQCTHNKNQWSDWDLLLRRCYEGGWHK